MVDHLAMKSSHGAALQFVHADRTVLKRCHHVASVRAVRHAPHLIAEVVERGERLPSARVPDLHALVARARGERVTSRTARHLQDFQCAKEAEMQNEIKAETLNRWTK